MSNVRSVVNYCGKSHATEERGAQNHTIVLDESGHGCGRFNWIKAKADNTAINVNGQT